VSRYELTPAQLTAVDRLEEAVDRCAYDFALAPGDCLVVNNRTALHGRTSFGLDSGRVLLRMRVHCAALDQGARTG
jgi:alpha-ketoglutarate-dependent taurine dioxygenase